MKYQFFTLDVFTDPAPNKPVGASLLPEPFGTA